MPSKLEALFMAAWRQHGYTESDIKTEYKLPGHRYRYDVAFPAAKLFVELHGFGFGHQRIAAVRRDAMKVRAAIREGWLVVPFTSGCLGSIRRREEAVSFVMALIEHRMLGTPLVIE